MYVDIDDGSDNSRCRLEGTMRTDTPKDVPTHLLENQDTYMLTMMKFSG
ncbi:MAG: hypothetical protein LUF30_05705 [Lachnospiraceae bacterium]|nr:hypothetical protein [Lachnospiraceae bacterium]